MATSANTEQKHQKQIKRSILSCLPMFPISCSTPRSVLTFTTTYEPVSRPEGPALVCSLPLAEDCEQAFRRMSTPPLLHKHHTADLVYPGCIQAHGADSAATRLFSPFFTNQKRRTTINLKALTFIKSSQYFQTEASYSGSALKPVLCPSPRTPQAYRVCHREEFQQCSSSGAEKRH